MKKIKIIEKENYLIKILIIFFGIFTIIKLLDHTLSKDAWQYGEWLINYQNGFVRRGLVGELILIFSKLFNNNIQISFFIILSIIVVFYYLATYSFIKNIKFNFITYLIFFSPLFYFFIVVISKVGIRKEILLYLFYLVYLINLSKNDYKISENWKYILVFPLLLLNHEGAFFYLPYIILPLFILVKKNEDFKKVLLQSLIFLIISSFVEIIIYFNKGTEIHTNTICSSLSIYAPEKCTWWGPVAALKANVHFLKGGSYFEGIKNLNSTNVETFYIFNQANTYLGFILYLIISFIPIYLFYKFFFIKKFNFFFLFIFFAFLFSLPLFHITEDWSRWFSIHFHLIAFNIFFLFKKKLVNINNNSNFNQINIKLIKNKFRTLFFISLFIYSTFLHHHHFFFKDVRLELTYLKIYDKIKKNLSN